MNLIFIYYLINIFILLYISYRKQGTQTKNNTTDHIISLFDNDSYIEPLLTD